MTTAQEEIFANPQVALEQKEGEVRKGRLVTPLIAIGVSIFLGGIVIVRMANSGAEVFFGLSAISFGGTCLLLAISPSDKAKLAKKQIEEIKSSMGKLL